MIGFDSSKVDSKDLLLSLVEEDGLGVSQLRMETGKASLIVSFYLSRIIEDNLVEIKI